MSDNKVEQIVQAIKPVIAAETPEQRLRNLAGTDAVRAALGASIK
jgi:hypothetical protein